jgi:hypothetical protein
MFKIEGKACKNYKILLLRAFFSLIIPGLASHFRLHEQHVILKCHRSENHKNHLHITILITNIDDHLLCTIKNHATSQIWLN